MENNLLITADDGFYFGLGVFETIHVMYGHLVLESYHKERFLEGLKLLGISLPCGDWAALRREMQRCMRKFEQKYPECKDDYVLKVCVTPDNQLIIPRKNHYTEEIYKKGFYLKCSPVLRNETSLFTRIKSLNYGDNILEKRRIGREGADEPVFLNRNGFLTEGATTNLFGILDGKLITPAVSCGLLPGTVRRYLLERYPVKETEVTPDMLLACSEVFVTNAVLGIMPVTRFEDHIFTNRAVTEKINWQYHTDCCTPQ